MDKRLLLVFFLVCLVVPSFSQMLDHNMLEVFNAQSGQVVSMPVNNSLHSIEGNVPPEKLEARQKHIIGTEDWEQRDPDKFPYSATVLLSNKGGGMTCSGAMVGDYTVLTAAHCVLKDISHNQGQLHDPQRIYAFAGGLSTEWKAQGVNIFVSEKARMTRDMDQLGNYDYAIIVLDKPIGRQTGYFGVEASSVSVNDSIAVLGFPGDYDRQRPWYSPGKVVQVTNGTFLHTADTLMGNSGGPTLKSGDLRNIIGILSFGLKYQQVNGSSRPANQALVSFVANYRNEVPPNQQPIAASITQETGESPAPSSSQQIPQEILNRLGHKPQAPAQTPRPETSNRPADNPPNAVIHLPPEIANQIRQHINKN